MLTDKLLVEVPKCRQRDSKRFKGGMERDGRRSGDDATLHAAKTSPGVCCIGGPRH